MACDLTLLDPEFKDKITLLLSNCRKLGYELRPFFALRDPWTQARLWRQSRTIIEIDAAVVMLKDMGAPHLSSVLFSVGPQYGKWATNALPGLSWHQWGEALDCLVVGSGGHAVWDPKNEGYAVYARQASLMGLEAGRFWHRQDSPHIQKRRDKVLSLFSWAQVEKMMLLRFGGL